ncbi:Tesmin/TSO1-like CXC domain protein [Nitzschia inconspicua]|uniref:Tesmin/TSO1-like CXC domain protein n=1 Tax=Nitzschia inconspicua TaxID=303405 RepID=A0A9K3L8D2_9STRA|nr:Tesmin/TSO1-like CXC domain protein [Nitzschia inconspicua]
MSTSGSPPPKKATTTPEEKEEIASHTQNTTSSTTLITTAKDDVPVVAAEDAAKSASPKVTPTKPHYPGHPMPHILPPHLHHPYYPYPGMPPPPPPPPHHYDPAYAIASAASVNSDSAKKQQKNPSNGSPSVPSVKSSTGEGDKSSPGSPPKSGGMPSTSAAGSPSSAAAPAAAAAYPPPPPPHPYYHPHAAAAYHRWAEAAAAAGYPPPPPHRYPPPYDPYAAAAMAYANSNSQSPASDHPPHGHPIGPYRFSDTTLRREALSHHHSSASEKNPASPGVQEPVMSVEHPNMAYMMEIEARADGATSPSQIEDFHREEVTSMGCTCKKTKCLKLYCQCFGVKIYCGQNCRCSACHNLPQFDMERETAIRIILTRNPNAFETKFQKNTTLSATRQPEEEEQVARQPGSLPLPARTLSHKLGCKCRKSACMKKYCECYAGNVKCSSNCRCVGCKNQPPGGKKDDDKPPLAFVSKKDPARHEAAYSLTFLKHGSAEKPARTNSSDKSEAGSMPSLASEESPTGRGGFQRHAELAKTVPPNTPAIESMPSSEQTAVDALLMAARAMTEMTELQEGTSVNAADAATPPIMNGYQNDESPEDNMRTAQRNLLDKFKSPKRKLGDGDKGTNDDTCDNATDTSPKRDHPHGDLSEFSKRTRLGSLINGSDDGLSETHNDAMEMSTPAKGTSGALSDLTPVSARCIDFQNMRVNDAKRNGPTPL